MTDVHPIVVRLAAGLVLSAMIGSAAFSRGSLSRSGVAGAVLIGTTLFGFGGWLAGAMLIAFFVSSSALSHYKASDGHKQVAAQMFDKGGRRDVFQALANGGSAAALAAIAGLASLTGNPELARIATAGMVGALATANADTWATELGVLSALPPRRITNLRVVVAPGTSGGVTGLGVLAALAGAACIGGVYLAGRIVAGLWAPAPPPLAPAASLALAATVAGLAGSLVDSTLGATVQAIYYDPARRKETERRVSADGTPNQRVRGWTWLNNDWVNFLATLAGAGVAAALAAA